MKPVVNFTRVFSNVLEGDYAVIGGLINHPDPALKGDIVYTSTVVAVMDDNEDTLRFETQNTIYQRL